MSFIRDVSSVVCFELHADVMQCMVILTIGWLDGQLAVYLLADWLAG